MGLFTESRAEEYIIIVGCSRLGAALANTLSEGEIGVMIIDKNEDSFRKLSPSYGGLTLVGDATEFHILKEAKIEDATAVITVTNNDNTNIMVAQIAKELFNIEHVIARLYDPECECVYQEFNIDTVCPAVLSVNEIKKFLKIAERTEALR